MFKCNTLPQIASILCSFFLNEKFVNRFRSQLMISCSLQVHRFPFGWIKYSYDWNLFECVGQPSMWEHQIVRWFVWSAHIKLSPQKMKGFSVSKFSLLKMVPSKHCVDFSGLQKPFVHSKTTLLINVVAITTELSLKVNI